MNRGEAMPFSAAQVAQRQAANEKEAAKASKERERAAEAAREEAELAKRLKRDYPKSPAARDEIWHCAVVLTDRLLSQFANGGTKLGTNTLRWASLFDGDKLDMYERIAETEKRVALLNQMARDYNDIGQVLTVVSVRNHELPMDQKSMSRQVRVTCTAPVPE